MARAYALIPAAGAGVRMGADRPKQYLEIDARPLLYFTLRALSGHPRIDQVLLVLAPGDPHFPAYECLREFSGRVMPLYCGGATRAASVFNGLMAAHDMIDDDDWVLVHDAVRPCVAHGDLDRLLDELADDDTGGLLAVQVADTLKRAGSGQRVVRTEPRDELWLAQTPQMFRYRLLVEALHGAGREALTDEAAAIEGMDLKPRLVRGSPRNIKVTYPEDLALAALILRGADSGDAGK